jgi:tetratricopeptide (TPR) repeat protein
MVIGNCRRLSGDRPTSAAAFDEARSHLDQGTGDPGREVRLLSFQASLASDTGKLEQALGLLARVTLIHRRTPNAAVGASIALQKASAFLSGGRYEEAMSQAEESLQRLTQRGTRLELLACSIVTECLALLGRPNAALRSLALVWPLYQQLRGRRSEPELAYLEALVLDSLGYIDEAEAAYNHSVKGYMEAELYKDAFLSMLTRFESLVRRGAWDRAARACQEALALERQIGAPSHGPMIELWRDLLTLANGQRLTGQRVLAARQAVIRHWSAPAGGPCSASPGTTALRWDGNGTAAPLVAVAGPPPQAAAGAPEPPFFAIEPPPLPGRLADGEFREILESYERQLIEAGLAHCGGRVRPTARLLGMSRTALQVRIERYGLSAVA